MCFLHGIFILFGMDKRLCQLEMPMLDMFGPSVFSFGWALSRAAVKGHRKVLTCFLYGLTDLNNYIFIILSEKVYETISPRYRMGVVSQHLMYGVELFFMITKGKQIFEGHEVINIHCIF